MRTEAASSIKRQRSMALLRVKQRRCFNCDRGHLEIIFRVFRNSIWNAFHNEYLLYGGVDVHCRKYCIESTVECITAVSDGISDQEAKENITINWPNIAGKSALVRKDRVYRTGLQCLRDGVQGSSEKSHSTFWWKVFGDSMVFMSSIRKHYEDLHALFQRKQQLTEETVSKLVGNGWQTFQGLEKLYWTTPFVKVAEYTLTGFVMKQGGAARRMLSFLATGTINKVRKYAINVVTTGSKAERCWRTFLGRVPEGNHDSAALKIFGDVTTDSGLAVLITEHPASHVGTTRLTSWTLTVFDPKAKIGDIVSDYIDQVLAKSEADLREDITQDSEAKYAVSRFRVPKPNRLALPFPGPRR